MFSNFKFNSGLGNLQESFSKLKADLEQNIEQNLRPSQSTDGTGGQQSKASLEWQGGGGLGVEPLCVCHCPEWHLQEAGPTSIRQSCPMQTAGENLGISLAQRLRNPRPRPKFQMARSATLTEHLSPWQTPVQA